MMQRSHPTRARQQAPAIFGSKLSTLCALTESNLRQLELQLAADRCHRELSARAEPAAACSVSTPDDTEQLRKSQWQNLDIIFTGSHSLDRSMKNCMPPAPGDEPRLSCPDGGSMNGYCYLCTTLEEHRSHLRSTKKVHGKTRRKYQLPASALPRQRPLSTTKLHDAGSEREPLPVAPVGALYKVTVCTGSRGTSLPVSLQIIGSEGRSEVTVLRKRARPGFLLMPNSKETFMVRATADLGYLKKLKLAMNRDGNQMASTCWVLDEIRIVKLIKACGSSAAAVPATYVFAAKRELFADESSIVEKLDGELVPTETKEYEVSIVTGKLSGCSSDTRVYVTLIGSKGRSAKLELKEGRHEAGDISFKKGSTQAFRLVTDDVGTISKIRIEHDGDLAVRWHLMLAAVRDLTANRSTLFKCNQVLAEEEGNARWRELHGKRLSGDLATSRKLLSKDSTKLYELEVHTGSVAFAGTNANVTVQLIGSRDRTTNPINLPHSSLNNVNAFEKGQVDMFRVTAADIGDIQKLRIRHDNTGLSPGWYLEQVIVRKFTDKSKSEKNTADVKKSSNSKTDESEASTSGSESKSLGDDVSSDSNPDQTEKRSLSSKRRSKGPPHDDEPAERERSAKSRRAGKEVGSNLRPPKSAESDGRFAKWRSGRTILVDSDEHITSEAESDLSDTVSKEHPDIRQEMANKKRLYRMYKKAGQARPRIDEYTFVARRWLAIDDGDRQTEVELSASSQRTFEA